LLITLNYLKMNALNLEYAARAAWRSYALRWLMLLIGLFLMLVPTANTLQAGTIKVLKTGLGFGTVSITAGGVDALNCGIDCNGSYTDDVEVTLRAVPEDGSVFLGWLGDVPGLLPTLSFTRRGDIVLRPLFGVAPLMPGVNPLPDLLEANITPEGIQAYLRANRAVNSAARFIKVLPAVYKQNWILMTRSESLQSGTALYPRLILPSPNARNVFSIGLARHGSFPGSHPLAIEYMQWDNERKNFRFHEIILGDIPAMGVFGERPPLAERAGAGRKFVEIDDAKCFQCHSTRNVLNRSAFPGTTGTTPALPPAELVKSKSKPNWDSYDSWAGMMPFNRDRIYKGSVEERAFRAIFNMWNWRETALKDSIRMVLEQLVLQATYIPSGDANAVYRDTNATTNATHVRFGFDPLPVLDPPGVDMSYNFGEAVVAASDVVQGGPFVNLRHSNPVHPTDEGRGVILFDLLGGNKGTLNQQRVADELASHAFITGGHYRDVRPVALAILRGQIRRVGMNVQFNGAALPAAWTTFLDARNGMSFAQVYENTMQRAKSLPRRKADLQRLNLDRRTDEYLRYRPLADARPADGLYKQYGGVDAPTIEQIRTQVFQRPIEIFEASDSVVGAIYIDREQYEAGQFNTEWIALFRYFLEPFGVSVDKWSMNVRGRSRAYTFADVFSLGRYIPILTETLDSAILADPRGITLPLDLTAEVNNFFRALPPAEEPPKFTDVQRIFNKACIECHGGLDYPPYNNYFGTINFSENESADGSALPPPLMGIDDRLRDSYDYANSYADEILRRIRLTSEGRGFNGMMPYGGPALSKADVETIRRWVEVPPVRAYSHGDPHIKTINGVDYDFQGAGEYVLLRGEYVEIQTRHKAVATTGPLGNGYTGLSTCVSVNAAVAMSLLGHRITYQPNLSGEPDPKNMQLRIDGQLVPLSDLPRPFAPNARVVATPSPGGIKIEGPGGTAVFITPGFWAHYQVWWLGIDVHQLRATEGLMGTILPSNWLPNLPDGTELGPMPTDLGSRYKILYGVFGEAWRVTDPTSLFDYAPGTSTRTFSQIGWPRGESPQDCNIPAEPGEPQPLPAMQQGDAEKRCADIVDPERRALCIKDLIATGEAAFADVYRASDKIHRNKYPKAPKLIFPADFQEGLSLPIKFEWEKAIDEDGDQLTYRHYVWPVDAFPNDNDAVEVAGTGGWFGGGSKRCALIISLVALGLIIILYLLLRKKRKWLFWLLTLLVLIIAFLLFKWCGKEQGPSMKWEVPTLKPAKAYYWKVIVEDGQGGRTESQMHRFELQ
jgi:hypothetical protein